MLLILELDIPRLAKPLLWVWDRTCVVQLQDAKMPLARVPEIQFTLISNFFVS